MIKQVVFTMLFSATIVVVSHAQKLKVNKTDEFTGKSVKETSRVMLFSEGMMDAADFRIRKIDSICFMDIEFVKSGIFSIHKDADLILLMDDHSIYTLKSMEYEIASPGVYGSYKGQVTYANPNDLFLEGLEGKVVVKVRIHMSDGYRDYPVKDKHMGNVSNAVKLVNN